MFTQGPPLWAGSEGDAYAGSVLALLHFNEADGTASFDEFRWTHGVNRYPSGLSTPTAEYPNS